jgi:hypothetical protein
LQQRTAILAAVLALNATGAGIVNAQTVYVGPRVYDSRAYEPGGRIHDGSLLPFEVMRIVRSTGLAPLSRPMRRGAYYEVIAANRAGGQMRIVVDAFAGDIVKVNPIMAGGPYGPRLAAPYDPQLQPPPRPVAPYARFDDGVPPVPPRNVPAARIATAPATAPAPDATAALPAARTPIPRARPSSAAREAPPSPPALAAAPPAAAPATAATPSAAAPALASSPLATAPPLAAAPAAAAPKATAPAAGAPSGEPKLVPVAPLE